MTRPRAPLQPARTGLQDRVKNLFVMTRLLGTAFDDYPTAEEAAQSFADTPPITA